MLVTSALEKLRQEDYCKVENSLSYMVSSKLARNLFQKQNKQTNKKAGERAQQVTTVAA